MSAMSKQTSVELLNMSPEDNHAVVKRKRGRPCKQTEARIDESSEFLNTSAEHNVGKRAKVTASSSEQQQGEYTEARERRECRPTEMQSHLTNYEREALVGLR